MVIPFIVRGEHGVGISLLLALPFLYAVVGFLSVALMCWLYNIIASRIGGIQLHLDTTGS